MSSTTTLVLQVSFSINGRKLTEYLLNIAHPQGASKAKFFLGHGFRADDPDTLALALLNHSGNQPVRKPTPHGLRLICTGHLLTPNGTRPLVTTVWQMSVSRSGTADFITAYPAP